MSNLFDNFERSVKNSLEGFEVPYSKEEWGAMEALLGNAKVANRRRNLLKYSAFLLGLLLLSSGAYYFGSMNGEGGFNFFESNKRNVHLETDLKEIEPKPSASLVPSKEEDDEILQQRIVEDVVNAVEDQKDLTSEVTKEKKEEVSTSTKSSRKSKSQKNSLGSKSTESLDIADKKKSASEKKVYRQIYSSYNGRDAKRSVLKLDIPRPTAQFGFDNTEGCEGLSVQFQPINNDGNYEYFWSFGDKNFSNKENPSHKYEKAGSYRVSLTIKYGDDEFVKYNHPIAIVVHPKPKADFDWTIDKSHLHTKVEFNNKSSQFNTVEWDFGDGEFTANLNPSHAYKSVGEYSVSLDVINEFNCVSTVTKKIIIAQKYNFTAPKLFTPNGDERNDEFMPDGLSFINNQFSLKIYKSSGEMIYETHDKSMPWDGKDNNGRIEDGTYIWILTIINPSGIDDVQQGSVVVNK